MRQPGGLPAVPEPVPLHRSRAETGLTMSVTKISTTSVTENSTTKSTAERTTPS
jgi:hypothetical protein